MVCCGQYHRLPLCGAWWWTITFASRGWVIPAKKRTLAVSKKLVVRQGISASLRTASKPATLSCCSDGVEISPEPCTLMSSPREKPPYIQLRDSCTMQAGTSLIRGTGKKTAIPFRFLSKSRIRAIQSKGRAWSTTPGMVYTRQACCPHHGKETQCKYVSYPQRGHHNFVVAQDGWVKLGYRDPVADFASHDPSF